MANIDTHKAGGMKLGIAIKLGMVLAAFGVLASGLTGYNTYHDTREILIKKASEDLVQSTQIMGRRFTIAAEAVGKDTLLLAATPSTQDAVGSGHTAETTRQKLAEQFKIMLSLHPEYYQARFISAQNNGIELVRVDRDDNGIKILGGWDLQEKLHYPYVYETLKLAAGKVHYSKIFINREVGAHAGYKKPTLQVTTPVAGANGKALGVIVINVDLEQIFALLKADLRSEYQLYLTNKLGDFLIHPDSALTFGFDYGRRFLVQDTFTPVASIVNRSSAITAVRTVAADKTNEVVGGFARIPFGDLSEQGFVIIGMTVPLSVVLAESEALSSKTINIVVIFSLLAIFLSALVAVVFVRPLKRLVAAVAQFSDTRELIPAPVHSNDELGLLASSIEEMQAHILDYLANLNRHNEALQQEINGREQLEKYEQFRSHTLEVLAGEDSIANILETIVHGMEQLNPGMLCTILLLDKEGKHLGNGIAPSLPDFYNAAIDGIEIGIGVGSCGTAAFTAQRVVVEDIQTHPYWFPFKELAMRAELGSCWSQPILASTNKVLGTFAIYHRGPHTPSESDIHLIEQSARLASIAIEHKQNEEEIKELAFYDHLTHLPNRRLLINRLQHALASSSRSSKQGALLFLDLDNFKTLNDTLGHDIGDLLLIQVAQRLEASVREGDTVARLGGDEFVVMLEDLSEQPFEAAAQAEYVGEKILSALNKPYLLGKHQYANTPSIGASLFNDLLAPEELMKQADIAMYQAKQAGRNTLRFFDPKMQESINVRAALEDALHNALENGEFQLHYQVQVDSAFRPLGAEALIRWQHPERGMVSPMQFIPLAEESGLIIAIGHWVLETACSQLKMWQQEAVTRDLVLAVNVSAKQFRQIDFVKQIQDVVQRHAINPARLKLELTESLLLEDIEDIIATMDALNEIGVQFSLDDFGTGYSSLQYLKQLPLDQLKIDQSFVRDIVFDSSDKAIVRTIIVMAKSLNLDVIAEGVETEEQFQLLLNKGCVHFQGYLFGKPMPIEQFEAILGKSIDA
jgi:diguanylate cyclase (GGDEF)-like protein